MEEDYQPINFVAEAGYRNQRSPDSEFFLPCDASQFVVLQSSES
jgi:hypothetical protein